MSIEQKLLTKLQPHADRIASGSSNDFDYLPAVLLQVVEGQKRQVQAVADAATTVARKLDETEVSISSVKTMTEQIATQSRRQMDLASASTNERLDAISRQLSEATQGSITAEATATQSRRQMNLALVATKDQLDSIFRQLGDAAQKSIAMEATFAALNANSQKEHRKSHRLLILTLVSIAISICLAVVIVLRH